MAPAINGEMPEVPDISQLDPGQISALLARLVTDLHYVARQLRIEQVKQADRITTLETTIAPMYPAQGLRQVCEYHAQVIRILIWVVTITAAATIGIWMQKLWSFVGN